MGKTGHRGVCPFLKLCAEISVCCVASKGEQCASKPGQSREQRRTLSARRAAALAWLDRLCHPRGDEKHYRQLPHRLGARLIREVLAGFRRGEGSANRTRKLGIGASGTGKSTLLFNLIKADIENGQGVAVLDPHGDLVERILGIVPETRVGDVVLLDPSDEEYSVGFNMLSAHSELEKRLLASDLVSVFQRLSTSWGDQMGSVLQNAILAFLESNQGGTLADLRRFLLEPTFRERFLETVSDPEIVYYWRKGFPQLAGNKSIGPVITRLETFLSPKAIRYMVSQFAEQPRAAEARKPKAEAGAPPQLAPAKPTEAVRDQAPAAPAAPAPHVEAKAPLKQPADLGRGGAQHQAIQHRLKQAAEALGFRSTVEKPILDGQGSVDLLLERADQIIACEISITTTIDHEVGNVAKCLKAGFLKIAVVCVDEDRLRKIAAAVSGSLGPEAAGRTVYYRPDDFIADLKTLAAPAPKAAAAPEMRRGYRIKRSLPALTPEEWKQREDEAVRAIAETMR
ncbi:type IV secretion system DNA-binding domain-containing protein [Patescibacteria group bacterium]|nr:type IV secretion system DNA-binding domain-containing protein [Patescibacteria group bacterium]